MIHICYSAPLPRRDVGDGWTGWAILQSGSGRIVDLILIRGGHTTYRENSNLEKCAGMGLTLLLTQPALGSFLRHWLLFVCGWPLSELFEFYTKLIRVGCQNLSYIAKIHNLHDLAHLYWKTRVL